MNRMYEYLQRAWGLVRKLRLLSWKARIVAAVALTLISVAAFRVKRPTTAVRTNRSVILALPFGNPKFTNICSPMAATKVMAVRVIDETDRRPLAGVTVGVTASTDLFPTEWRTGKTEEDGVAWIGFATAYRTNFSYQLRFTKDGYVFRSVSWSTLQRYSIGQIPSEYTVIM